MYSSPLTKASACQRAIQQEQVVDTIGDISRCCSETRQGEGFGVVCEFVGHGIGKSMHEDRDTQASLTTTRGKGPRLKVGWCWPLNR